MAKGLEDNNFNADHWIFNLDDISEPSIDAVQSYFRSFKHMDLNSHIYALTAIGNMSFLFEVYKTHSSANMTISQLCKFNRDFNKAEQINRNQIWIRRKNLTGIMLKVGIMDGSSFITINNGVIDFEKMTAMFKIFTMQYQINNMNMF